MWRQIIVATATATAPAHDTRRRWIRVRAAARGLRHDRHAGRARRRCQGLEHARLRLDGADPRPVINVTPADARLADIVAAPPAGTTIRFADGTYPVVGDYSNACVVTQPGVTLRSASGDPDEGRARRAVRHRRPRPRLRRRRHHHRPHAHPGQDHLVHTYPGDGPASPACGCTGCA